MRKLFTFVSFISMLLLGCASEEKSRRLEETLNQYADTIRWGALDRVATLHAPSFSGIPGDQDDIKITGYEPVSNETYAGGDEFGQTVKITFYRNTDGKERNVTQQQSWRYDPTTKVWRLYSPIPRLIVDR